MSDQWYHEAFGQEFGPLSEEDLARMLVSGELHAEDSVRDGTTGPWVAAGSVPVLMKLAESLQAETAEVATDIDSFLLIDESAVNRALARPQSKAVQPAPAQPAPRAAAAPQEWYFQTFGETLGPVTLIELTEMAKRGEISPGDAIRQGTAGKWSVASDNATLFPQSRSVPRAATPASRFETPSGAANRPSRQQPARAPAPAQTFAAPPPAPPVAPVAKDTDINWYCYVNEQELGPMGTNELQGLVASGHITAEVYVKYSPQGEWVFASQVPNLLPVAAYPPVQPVAAAAPVAAPAPAGTHADEERSELLKQLVSLLQKEGLSTDLLGSINTSAPQTGAGWYCNISGAVMGPVAIEALVQMVLQKRIFPDDLIRLGTSGEWFPASTVPDLFPDTTAKGKKSGLDDGQHVMDRIDQIYREAQEAQAKQAMEKKTQPVAPAGSTAPKNNAASDVLRNMNANIARSSVFNTPKPASKPTASFELPDIKMNPKILGGIAVVGLLVAGFFFLPSVLGDFGASRAFDQLMVVNGSIINAQESPPDPATWEKTSKPLLETIDKVSKDLGVAKQGSARRDVSRMAGYLKKMVETVTVKPVPGQEDEFTRNKSLFDDYTKAAMKKLGKL